MSRSRKSWNFCETDKKTIESRTIPLHEAEPQSGPVTPRLRIEYEPEASVLVKNWWKAAAEIQQHYQEMPEKGIE